MLLSYIQVLEISNLFSLCYHCSVMMQLCSVVMVLFCIYGSSNSYKVAITMSQSSFKQSMMKKVSGVVCASAIFVSSISGMAMPAMAAVGEGDLPPGAMAFQKLLKYQVRCNFNKAKLAKFDRLIFILEASDSSSQCTAHFCMSLMS